MSSPITTHILDTALGRPAAGVPVTLERRAGEAWELLGRGTTDADGRIADLMPAGSMRPGVHRITFATGEYFAAQNTEGFYPTVPIIFSVADGAEHYHVPLLLNPFGFSTYRGS
jgi:5-hydroxyisourate hydrolase